jgi:hypothetical protein
MHNYLTPLEVCLRLIGPRAELAVITGVVDKAPYAWVRGSRFRQPGDLPYPAHMRALLAHSAARNLGLTADHLIWGAPEAEVQAILAARAPHQVAAE